MLRPYSRGGTFNALAPAQKGSNPPTPNVHRLLPGLPGYLIPFAPLAFVSQCQELSRDPPSPLVFLTISTHFTATPYIPVSSPVLKHRSLESSFAANPRNFTPAFRR